MTIMKQSDTYKNEVKNFKNDLIENLIDYHIDITDFNVIKPFIIDSIEGAWKGNVDDLKNYLAEQNQCSVGDIENLLDRSNSRNWPAFFRNESMRMAEDFQATNNLQLSRVVFLDNDKEEKRRRFKEFKFCILHHFKRSFECNDIGKCNTFYHISRFGLCCCWQSYIWRLICYKCTSSAVISDYYTDKSSARNKLCMSCCLCAHLCCWPFHLCYWFDKKNFEPRIDLPNESRLGIENKIIDAEIMMVNRPPVAEAAVDVQSIQEEDSQVQKYASGEKKLDTIEQEQSELSDKNKEEKEDGDVNEIENSEPINSVQEEGTKAKDSGEVEKGSEHESSSEENLDTVEEHTEGNSESVDVVDGGNVNLAFQDESGHENDQPLESVDNVTTQQPTKFHYTNKYFQSFLYIAIESKDVSVPSSGDGEVNDTEFYFWIKIPFNFNIDLDDKKDLDLF